MEKKKQQNKGIVLSGLGFELIGLTIGAFVVGDKVDKYFGLNKKGTIIVFFAVFISWCVHFGYIIVKISRDLNDESEDSSGIEPVVKSGKNSK